MTDAERDTLLRRYAAHETTWHALRESGFEDYIEVLAGLAALGLRPPVARMAGPNVAARERGRVMLRDALHRRR